ncbi:MAG: Major Facilitator Superfamily [Rhodobacteraceae bacterium HLUCCA12]|nr:MAG: Major Facilitator Superfamily [Rhodobacteraceae bacterium HLUCCA12]
MKRLLAIEFVILAVFVLLGNGIRSIGMSTVLVSQGEFASFLNISAERTDMLIESIMGGSLLALALAPFLITPHGAMRLARNAAILAVLCYGAVGITMHVNPSLITREVVVIAAFAFGGFAVAFFAPLAQLAIGQEPDARAQSALTTVWTAAQPIALLATPQLVKYVAFDIGVGNFFFVLAALPVVFLLFVPVVFAKPADQPQPRQVEVPWRQLAVFVLLILLFQASTISVSLAGIDHLATHALMALVLVAGAAMVVFRQRLTNGPVDLPAGVGTLMAVLFLLQISSTGLYDTAYLVRHLCSVGFIADRATYGAMAQIAGVFGAGAILLRWPQSQNPLLWLALTLGFIGSALMLTYPGRTTDALLLITSKAILSGGVGIGTAVLVRAILAAAGTNAVIVMAPAFLILLGTEVGMESLQIVFQTTTLAGFDENVAYENVFMVQAVSIVVAIAVLLFGRAPQFVAAAQRAETARR